MNLNAQTCIATDSSEARSRQPRPPLSEPLPQDWAPADRVVLDIELPHRVIAEALKRRDDAAIWREYARARDQDAFLHFLARLAGTYSTKQLHLRDQSRPTEWHHVLVAVPFLLPASSWPVPAPSAADRAGAGSLMGELQDWAGDEQPARLVLGCVKHVDLVRWSPVTQQDYLRLLAREQTNVPAPIDGVVARIPEGAVQLAFAIGSVRCWNALPQLPGDVKDGPAQWDLCARMAACLSYMNHCEVRPEHVLPAAPLADAVLAGVRLWTQELAEQHLVTGWDVRLGLKDLVYEELTAAEGDTILLPVRRHQVGADGVSILTADLASRFGRAATTAGQSQSSIH